MARNRASAGLETMMNSLKKLMLAVTILGSAPAFGQDIAKGQAVFKRVCASCHSVDPAKPKPIAPTLAGVLGRTGGTLPGARYSSAMKKIAPVWTESVLDTFLTNTKSVVPGGTMMIRLPKVEDRKNVIAYLKSLK
jgi:cytochrome c